MSRFIRALGLASRTVRHSLIIPAILFSQCVFASDAGFPWLDELRAGVMANTGYGHSPNAEVQALFAPLPAISKPYDPNWAWLLSPRPLIGASISLQGKTSQAYAGLAWTLPISGPFFVELSAGGLVHDQNLNQVYNDRPSPLTSRFLFRESIAIGYEFNENWRILAFADHGSDGNLSYRNISLNHFGALLGYKFGPPTRKPLIADSAPSLSTFSWAGPYIGFGVALAHSGFNFKSPAPESTEAGNSVNLAGQAGYNWVFGPAVLGAELDYAVQGLDGSTVYNASDVALSASSLWLATARGRIGTDVEIPLVSKRSLIYATGGAAFSRIANNFCPNASVQCFTGTNRDIGGGWSTQATVRSGWTAGAGVELPVAPTVTVKLEYLYVDFGTVTFNNGVFSNEVAFHEQILRGGMNFKFN